MTKTDRAIHIRAEEIWFEGLYKQEDFSFLKALSQAWKEHHIKSKRGPERYKLF